MDATSVYWTSFSGGMVAALMKAPLGGGPGVSLAEGQLFTFNDVAIEAASVYWTTSAGDVMTMPSAGGIPTTLVSPGQNQDGGADYTGAQQIALSSTSIFWLTESNDLLEIPLSGGIPSTVATGVSGLATNASSITWTTSAGDLMTMPSGGRAMPVALADGVGPFAVDATTAYWAPSAATCPDDGGACNGSIMKTPLAGGSSITLASAQNSPVAVSVDDTSVYWIDRGTPADNYYMDGTVMKVPIGGGPMTTLFSAQDAYMDFGVLVTSFGGSLAVGPNGIYWTATMGSTAVMGLTPK